MNRQIAVAFTAAVLLAGCGSGTSKAGPIARASSSDNTAETTTTATAATEAPTTAKPTATQPPAKTKTGTRDNPTPAGQQATIHDTDNGDIDITVTGYVADGWPTIQARNKFNPPPPAGKRYVLVGVTATYHAGKKKQTATLLAAVSWSMFGASAVEAKPSSCSLIVPDQIAETSELLDGGTTAGNVCFGIAETDAAGPLLFRVSESFCLSNCDAAWFKVQ